tara:strand:- start:2335 stop:2556 length:222 start_codon:yes stop_codon:yes gene_type:complete
MMTAWVHIDALYKSIVLLIEFGNMAGIEVGENRGQTYIINHQLTPELKVFLYHPTCYLRICDFFDNVFSIQTE